MMRKVNIGLFLLFISSVVSFAQDSGVMTGAGGIEFRKIPSGSFIYGRFQPPAPVPDTNNHDYTGYAAAHYCKAAELARRDRRPGFEVQVDSFYLSKYELTQAEWKRVMKNNPSQFRGDSLPVESVSWEDANEFIRRLNTLDPSRTYRLPTEFEWEYAARAGKPGDISWEEIMLQAQLNTDSTNAVGTKKPNAWGLFDMAGNVWEWTSDVYNEKIFADSVPATYGAQHVIKGASFTGDVKNATYMTHAGGPANKWDVGFRVVMLPQKKNVPEPVAGRASQNKPVVPGWHLSRSSHQGTTPKVTFTDGVITLEQQPFGQGGVLLTDELYGDFELSVDVKIDSFSNGGIFLRSTESGQAYQVELAEPGGTGNLLGERMNVSVPAEAKTKASVWKANQWNNFRIRMTGEIPTITLWINGKKMWQVTQTKNDFIAGATRGRIGLQVHWSATYSEEAKGFDMSSSWRPGAKHKFRRLAVKKLGSRE